MRRKQTIIAAACLAFVTVFAVFMTTAFALGPSSDEIYNGIDVSKYQGNIDFERVANDGIEAVSYTHLDVYKRQGYGDHAYDYVYCQQQKLYGEDEQDHGEGNRRRA